MENKSHALAAGLFVIAVAAMLLGLTSWLTADKREGDIYEMSTTQSVSGLSEQAAVRFRGINVGKVVRIGFDPANPENVLVRIDINKGLPLTKGTFAALGYQGVTGLAFVQLDNDGDDKTALTTDNDSPTRIPLRPGLLSIFADQGSSLLQQAQNISERINELLSTENQDAIIGTVESIGTNAAKIGAAAERIQTIMDAQLGPRETNIPALVAETQATMKTLQTSASAITATAQSLTAVATDLSKPGGTLEQLDNTTRALADSAKAINTTVLPSVSRASASAGRTADAATRAAQSADQVLDSISENPQSLIFGGGEARPGPGEPGFVAPAATAR